MAYATYTTQALVCGSFDHNTSNRSYLLFTEDAGMLYADARSVREEKSRQRYALQDFSSVRVSLIKGKRGWKVGSVQALKNYYNEAVDKSARGNVVSVFRLLRRFVKGEEPANELFTFTSDALDVLVESKAHQSFMLQVVQVRMLAFLGYVDSKLIPEVVKTVMPSEINSCYESGIEKQIEALYRQAISVSHL